MLTGIKVKNFKRFESKKLGLQNPLRKGDYQKLARFVPEETIDSEIVEKLDPIVAVARSARPTSART